MSIELKIKSIKGFKWTSISQLTNQFIVIGFNIAMMNFLSPLDYGVFAVPFVIYSFLRLIQDFGFTEAFIKENKNEAEFYKEYFWFVILVGFGLSFTFYLSSPLIENLTGNMESISICKWLSLALLLGCLSIPIDGKIRKELDFKSAFLIELLANLVSGIFGVWFVYKGYGWLSLPLKVVIYSIAISLLSLLLKFQIPSFSYNFTILFSKIKFALPNISEQVLNYFSKNIDTIVIEKYIGSVQLGVYDRSYKFLLLPIQQISNSFSKVMYPALVNFQDDKKLIADNYLRVCGLISLVTFPLMFGIFVIAEEVVLTLFGAQWIEMIPLIKVFCIIGGFQSVSNLSANIFYLTDKNFLLLKYSIISKLFYFIILLWTVIVYKDIYIVSIIVAISSLIISFPLWYLTANILGIKSSKILTTVLPQILTAAIMAFSIYLLKYLVSDYILSFYLIILLTLIGVLITWGLFSLTKNKHYLEMKKLFKHL